MFIIDLILIQNKFNIDIDSINIIKNFLFSHYVNLIIHSWYSYIKRKTDIFYKILNFDKIFIGYQLFYNLYDPDVVFSFYYASKIISNIDDISLWEKFFKINQIFINAINLNIIQNFYNINNFYLFQIIQKSNFIFYKKYYTHF